MTDPSHPSPIEGTAPEPEPAPTASRKQAAKSKPGPKLSSTHISLRKAQEAIAACDFARTISLPLNTGFCISFQGSVIYGQGPCVPADANNTSACREALSDVLRDVAAPFGIDAAFVITFENPPTGGWGLHAHVLIHGPQDDEAHARFRAEIERRLNKRFQWDSKRSYTYEPIRMDPYQLPFLHSQTRYSTTGSLRYMLKGTEPSSERDATLDGRKFDDGGAIYGPRVIVSQTINQSAQKLHRLSQEEEAPSLATSIPALRSAFRENIRNKLQSLLAVKYHQNK